MDAALTGTHNTRSRHSAHSTSSRHGTHSRHSTYHYTRSELGHHHAYLLPVLERVLKERRIARRDVLDFGCGNGSVAAWLYEKGFDVVGIDGSAEGIACARAEHPEIPFYEGSVYDDHAAIHGRFPVVISLEVVEHLYDPRQYARRLYDLVERGGTAIVSTPFHGYWKNLAVALAGRFDTHFSPLWDHGHIKFWSESNLRTLLLDAGFRTIAFHRAGRVGPLAKSTIAVAVK
ncbi:MAG: class I SAM-dependent methyltransferase [Rhodothermales bacterium]